MGCLKLEKYHDQTPLKVVYSKGKPKASREAKRELMWLSVDPPMLDGRYLSGSLNGGVYDSKNLGVYDYVQQNPVNKIDPDGEACVPCVSGLIGAGIGASLGAGIEIGMQLYNQGEVTDWKAVGGATARGLIAGAVAGATGNASLTLTESALLNSGGEVAGGIADRAISGEKIFNKGNIITDAVAGGTGGAVAKKLSPIAEKAKSTVIERTTSTIIKKGIEKTAKGVLTGSGRGAAKKAINTISDALKSNTQSNYSTTKNNMQRQKENRRRTMNSGQSN